MSDSPESKWDFKQISAGAGSAVLALALMQSQGIDLMTKKQDSQNALVIEKAIANATRIDKLEDTVRDLNRKIDQGFESLRQQIKSDSEKLSDIVREGTSDRFTKSEHIQYRNETQRKFDRLYDEVHKLKGTGGGK